MIACANDNDHTTPLPEIDVNDCVPTILSCCRFNNDSNLNFNYDDNGRLTGAKFYNGGNIFYNISYSGTTITVEEVNETVGLTFTHTITVSEDDIVNVQAYNLELFLMIFGRY